MSRVSPVSETVASIADAIRAYFKSIGSSAVASSDGVERVYYSGFSLQKLAEAIALATSGLAPTPAQSIDELAAEITEEIRCEQRARERVAKAEEISGDIYLLKVLLSVIDSQSAALREYEAAASPDTSTVGDGK